MQKPTRIEIAKVAASVQGVTADNFLKFCETLEGWVSQNVEPKNPGKK